MEAVTVPMVLVSQPGLNRASVLLVVEINLEEINKMEFKKWK